MFFTNWNKCLKPILYKYNEVLRDWKMSREEYMSTLF